MKRLAAALLIALFILGALPAAYANCGPSKTGPPCGQGGIAAVGPTQPSLSLSASNPVHLVTGNKYQRDVDLPANPTAPGIEIIRHYNAMDVRPSVLGRGWSLSYDTQLFRVNSGWQIVQADGGRIDFPDGSLQADGSHRNEHGRLDHVNDHHNWFWTSGIVLRFDHSGWLVSIRWSTGESVHILRHTAEGPLQGAIDTVRNDRGQTLSFHYVVQDNHARLGAIDSALGRFQYIHDAPSIDAIKPLHRLTKVSRPDGMQRHYLYETALQAGNAYALTGIELSNGPTGPRQRINTWEYDHQGRAVRSVAGEPESEHHAVLLDYQHDPTETHPGVTVVTDARQRKTTFHTARRGGRHVLTEVEGAGCQGCAAPGTRADYDESGRLTRINGTEIQHRDNGAIHALRPAQSGWPGLELGYRIDGLRDYWQSAATGRETMRYNASGLPVERRFANGDTTAVEYDIQHRPITITDKHDNLTMVTRLSWYGNHLARIDHPAETESREYDKRGRVSERRISRVSADGQRHLSMTESFEYDEQDRLRHHRLPEGGSLSYEWGQGPQLKTIYWIDTDGTRRTIIETTKNQAGYRYGNGLHLDTMADADHRIRHLRVRDQDTVLWSQDLHYDDHQRIHAEQTASRVVTDAENTAAAKAPRAVTTRYAYDTQSRLIGWDRVGPATANSDTPTNWLAWHADGSAAAARKQTSGITLRQQRDASGLPRHIDGVDLHYGANRRLSQVSRDGRRLARYQHNAFGYRIARQGKDGTQTDYFYLNNQLIAEAEHRPGVALSITDSTRSDSTEPDTPAPRPALMTRRYVYAHQVPVAIIDYTHEAGELYAIHADLQGAPRLMTDSERRIRWQADYSPLGKAHQVAGDMRLDLRLPGQVEDPDTGWHDNLLRTYIPQWGHYLEPDPLGPVPGSQAYGYAAQQPRRYTDPMGLLLFAFDGTRQSADTRSNVWKLSQYYLDGPVHYHSGPGNSMFVNWDALTAHQARQIVDTQWKWLLLELSRTNPTDVTPIDILGFSRGAALARHFANLISQHVDQGLFRFDDPFYGSVSSCVDLRFMGLFDTVAQFGVAGSQNRNYDLTIAPAWEWVAHAVALHERRWLFPLTSASDQGGYNVVEAPFIGAHSDIGGGVLPEDRDRVGGRGDLSDVALNWVLWQARAASVRFGEIAASDRSVTNPILHDFRSPILRQVQDGDRSIQAATGGPLLNYQDDDPRLGRALREQTEDLIKRVPNWQSDAGAEVGTVDMDGYGRWLHDELGWHALPV